MTQAEKDWDSLARKLRVPGKRSRKVVKNISEARCLYNALLKRGVYGAIREIEKGYAVFALGEKDD